MFKEPLSETQLSQLAHHTRKRYPETPSADLDPNTILGLPPTGARAFANSILAVYHPQVRGCSAIIDEFHESAAYSCCMTILFLQLLATLIVKYFKHALLPTLISLFSSLLFSSLLFHRPLEIYIQRLARREPLQRGRSSSIPGSSSLPGSSSGTTTSGGGCLQALDVHGGHHASVTGRGAHGWALKAAQAGISSLGGAPVLLPLFASCLASNAPVVADVGLVAVHSQQQHSQQAPQAKNYWGGNVACRLFTLARFSQGQATNQV